ncbi:MAG TPA: hypothetical protein VFP35_01695 [Candidatus Saccharimonadales bacterium]|nr:hypothetical protein [Candidatus Saccharimonadales bacterium]
MPAELALIHSPSGPMVRSDVFHAVKPVVIDEETPYEMDVMDGGEIKGRFVARYASSLAITKSGLIPEGLMYPDRRVIFDDETPAIADGRQIENACELMLPAPGEFDQDWCDWFNELYAGKNVRIGIEATYVYWQSPPSALTANHEAAYCPWQNRGAPGMKRMESIDIADYEDNDEEGGNPIPTLVDGEIISAKMLSFWEEDRWEHIPYAILSDVRRAETGELIEDDSATELLVPLDQDDGPVIIYKPE